MTKNTFWMYALNSFLKIIGEFILFFLDLSQDENCAPSLFVLFCFDCFQFFRCCKGKKLDAKFQVVRFCKIVKPSKERNLAPSRTLTEVFEAIFKKWKIVEFEIVAPNMTDKRHNHFNTKDFLGVFVST